MNSNRNSKCLTCSLGKLNIYVQPGNYQSRSGFDNLNTIDTDMLKQQLTALTFRETLCYGIINKTPYFHKECYPENGDDISQCTDANQSN